MRTILKMGFVAMFAAFISLDCLNCSNFVNIIKIHHYRLKLDRGGMWLNGLYRSVQTGPNAQFNETLNEISNIQTGFNSIWSNNLKIIYVIPHVVDKYNHSFNLDEKDLYDFILLRDDHSFWICVLNEPKESNPDGSLSWWNRFIEIR